MGAFLLFLLAGGALPGSTQDQDSVVRTFRKIVLTDKFHSEGAHFGDFNRDGKVDVVAGPFWYEGPDFRKANEYYPAQAFDKEKYSKNFQAFPYDYNGDGWTDILILGWPEEAENVSWYENPQGKPGHWTRHQVSVAVEGMPRLFTDLTGDGKPEVVCASGRRLGYLTIRDWKFHPISPVVFRKTFTPHGLGVGDVNGDGRPDLLEVDGWWEQPASLEGDPEWKKRPARFSEGRGADLYACDVDGDGDNDVIGCLEAHGYGLAWFEHVKEEGRIVFRRRLIMGARPDDSPYGVRFSQPHAIALADIDGDGVKDIITGKRHFAHGSKGDVEPLAAPVLYWFRTVRSAKGVEFVPYLVDDASGVGTQVEAGDVNGDGYMDIVAASKMGAFVFLQEHKRVSKAEWEKAQPRRIGEGGSP